jgi:segregation and condensation protein B
MTQPLKFILEAAILAAHQPLSIEQLSDLFDESVRPTHNELAQALEGMSADCADRGVELVEVASGFRYQIKTDVYPHVAKLWTERQSKYSRALLETLSLIAYRQPITRAEIEAVRGVAVSSHIVRTLEEREWIRVVGHREVPGRPALYSTTRAFLDYFKLKSLEDLPTLSEIKDLDNMAPELDFAPLPKSAQVQVEANAQDAAQVELPTNADNAEIKVAQVEAAAKGEDSDIVAGEIPEDAAELNETELAEIEHTEIEHTEIEQTLVKQSAAPETTPLEAAVTPAEVSASEPSSDDTSTQE